MLHLRPSDYRVMPWKDGGGSTTEIAIEPEGFNLSEPFLWRVSSATVVASGPFSVFPGYVRSLILLTGAGLLLDIKGKARQRLKNGREPLVFNGDDAVNATLIQGPCVDFGVISDPARVKTTLQVLQLGAVATSLTLFPTTLLFAPRGLTQVEPLGVQLGPGETLYLKGAETTIQGRRSGSSRELCLSASERHTPLVAVMFWPV